VFDGGPKGSALALMVELLAGPLVSVCVFRRDVCVYGYTCVCVRGWGTHGGAASRPTGQCTTCLCRMFCGWQHR
jgi:hypothetical protein